jgi:hypothetical protein
MFEFSSIIFLIAIILFFIMNFLIGSLFILTFKKESLWMSIKGAEFSIYDLFSGIIIFLFLSVTSVALMFSGALRILASLPILASLLLGVYSLAVFPIVVSGIVNKYMLRKIDFLSIKNLIYSCLFISILLLLPASLGLYIVALTYFYALGVGVRYLWYNVFYNYELR